jgi:CDP-diacylglycerol--glycerol-3-phosphate 3-phosphatidyltransferase
MAEPPHPAQQPPAGRSAPSVWNVPNALTTLRIVMVPFFGWALLTDGGDSVLWRLVAWAIFAVAMVTDKIDGDLARKHGLVTDFGKIADPIADKAITGMAFIGLSLVGDLWWWVTVLVLLREWSVTGMRLLMARHAVIPAARGGKIKTVLQTFALGLLVLPLRQVGETGGVSGALAVAGSVLWWGAVLLMAAAVAMTVWTGVEFFRDAVVQRREHKRASI